MSYRRFWIVNSLGQITYLTEKSTKISLSNPKGLGYSSTLDTVQYSNMLKVIDSRQEFLKIEGDMQFYDSQNSSRYEKYNQFISFLTHAPLTIYYQLPTEPVQTYHADIELSSIGKTESGSNRILSCDFSFQQLSRWKGEEITISGSDDSYTIVNEGHMPAGFMIVMEGNMTDPYFTLSQDGQIYGEARFVSQTAFNRVCLDSTDGQQALELQQGGTILADPLSYQDLEISDGAIYTTFLKLATGSSVLTVGSESGTITSVTINYSPLFRSV